MNGKNQFSIQPILCCRTESMCKKMLVSITFSFLLLAHQSLGTNDISRLMKKFPTWSFGVASVETLIKNSPLSLRGFDQGLTDDTLRAKVKANLGPNATHIVTKIGDPKWPKRLPATFDAREHWKACSELIGTMDDESYCTTDTPAAVASVAADRYCIFTNGTFKERLSQEMLAACAEACTCYPSLHKSWEYAAKHGIPTGGPYNSHKGCVPTTRKPCKHTACSYVFDEENEIKKSGHGEVKPCCKEFVYDKFCPTKCSNRKYKKALDEDRKQLAAYYFMLGNEFLMRREILSYGPILTSILLFEDLLEHPDGIYEKKSSRLLTGFKSIKLIGWGKENGTKYWLAVNTWDHWGDSKVFRIPRGVDYVSVESMTSAGFYEDKRTQNAEK